MWRQPKTVWSVAFACVIAFMGIGLVDPILKPIADELGATPSQVSLLFTSYMAVMGVAMLGHRLGLQPDRRQAHPAARPGRDHRRRRRWPAPRTRIAGIVGFRAVLGPRQRPVHRDRAGHDRAAPRAARWRRRSSSTRPRSASASRPARCSAACSAAISWRWPFFGVARPDAGRARRDLRHPARHAAADTPPTSLSATRSRRCGTAACSPSAVTALLYNFGFFTLLAFTPFPLDLARARHRPGLLRLGPAAGHRVGVRRAVAAAPVRHRARHRRRAGRLRRDARGDGALDRQQDRARRRASSSPARSSASTTP